MPSKIRMMPHRTASPACVGWGPWRISTGAEFRTLGGSIEKWDFGTESTLRGEAVIDAPELLRSTGLLSLDDILLVAQVECNSTFIRTTSSQFLSSAEDSIYKIDVCLEPGQYAGQLSASLHLVLGRGLPTPRDITVPSRMGARLASSDVLKLELGTSGSLFPTEALDFSGSLPSGVPWILNVTYEDLDDAFMGAVRLFVNTAHPAGLVALNDEDANAKLVRSALRVDIARSLILRVASQERATFDLSREFDAESIGHVVASFCRHRLKADLDSVARMITNDPIEFQARLQAGFGYLQQLDGE